MEHSRLYWAIWTLVTGVIPLLWISSLILQHKTFKNLYRTISEMQTQLFLISGMLAIRDISPSDVQPSKCGFCGATLMGGATQHKPDCEIRKLIRQYFPEVH